VGGERRVTSGGRTFAIDTATAKATAIAARRAADVDQARRTVRGPRRRRQSRGRGSLGPGQTGLADDRTHDLSGVAPHRHSKRGRFGAHAKVGRGCGGCWARRCGGDTATDTASRPHTCHRRCALSRPSAGSGARVGHGRATGAPAPGDGIPSHADVAALCKAMAGLCCNGEPTALAVLMAAYSGVRLGGVAGAAQYESPAYDEGERALHGPSRGRTATLRPRSDRPRRPIGADTPTTRRNPPNEGGFANKQRPVSQLATGVRG
jgi:hypothetical protein